MLRKLELIAKKRELERDLIAFTSYFFDKRGVRFVENWHHRQIADALNAVKAGLINNLLINIPPRYGKTEIAVINFIAQSIAENPKCKFMHLSYSDELALENSAKAKELLESEEFQELWPIQLKKDSKSKKKWWTEQGGGLYATAAGGAITGFGAGSIEEEWGGAIIIDDPLKVDDADRDGERNAVNKRLNSTIKSRRNNTRRTPIIIIMQRIHEDDMSGFVLNDGIGEQFYHLNLPAIQPGDVPLWEFKDTIEDLEKQRRADPRTFNAQMMQDPTPDDGDFFKRDWFKRFDIGQEPATINYICSDYAVTDGDGDYTEHGVGGFDEKEDLWMLDWWAGQTSPDKWIDEELRLANRYSIMAAAAEGGPIRRSVEPFLAREMQQQGIYYRKEWVTSNKDKATNARSFQALASQGKIHIPNNPWGEALLSQLLKFPNGKFDDKVDVCGLFGRLLDQAFGPRSMEIAPDSVHQPDGYGFDEDDNNDNSWKTG